ncbi:hypothetical protein RvY_11999 [Ramazzottius varieornatus]|uniref:RING-type domain-containing protein n=1 Tax=Ramazzottius varieornatus TaxID=947166 RepID=A0A1D1VI26_RAMVA|nr:hypothetical protein RvY_11999 [Ramazzottius varieornatus]
MNPDRDGRTIQLTITARKVLHAKYGIVDEEQKNILEIPLRGEDQAMVKEAIHHRRSQETDRKFSIVYQLLIALDKLEEPVYNQPPTPHNTLRENQEIEDLKLEKTCKICYSADRDCLVSPCKHVSCCQNSSQED